MSLNNAILKRKYNYNKQVLLIQIVQKILPRQDRPQPSHLSSFKLRLPGARAEEGADKKN